MTETMILVRNRWEIATTEINSVTGKPQWIRRDMSYICDVGDETEAQPLPPIPTAKVIATKYPQLQSEFPDFAIATLPAIPAEWSDISWHNDVAPCFNTTRGTLVYVDYFDIKERETGGGRYHVMTDATASEDGATEELLNTDDWAAVLACVDKYAEDNCDGHTDTGRGICAHCGKVL